MYVRQTKQSCVRDSQVTRSCAYLYSYLASGVHHTALGGTDAVTYFGVEQLVVVQWCDDMCTWV